MKLPLTVRYPIRSLVIGCIVGVLSGLVGASEASAQDGRMLILVPMMERVDDADRGFGRDVVRNLRDLLEDMDRHAPVDQDDYERILDEYDLEEEDLDCTGKLQVAMQVGAQLVMCGSYEETSDDTLRIAVRFTHVQSQESIEIDPFDSDEDDRDEAAATIFQGLESVLELYAITGYCLDYLSSGLWDDALSNCEQALAINEASVTALYGKAQALMNMGLPSDVADIEQESELGAADDVAVGEEQIDRAALEEALVALDQVLELDPIHHDALKSAGIVAGHLEMHERARGYFDEYLELNPGDSDVRIAIAVDMMRAGDPAGALQVTEAGLQEDPSNLTLIEYSGHFALNAATLLGQQLEDNGEGGAGDEVAAERDRMLDAALDYYEQVFNERGAESEPGMLRNMIVVRIQQERFDEAIALAERILDVRPDDASLLSQYATALRRAERYEEALQALDQIAAIDPEFPNLDARRGNLLLQTGDIDQARTAFDQALAAGQIESDAVARNMINYANGAYFSRDQFEQAIEVYEIARNYAEEDFTVGLLNYVHGFSIYRIAEPIAQASTAEAARQTLPMFREALEMVQNSTAYAEQSNANIGNLISALEQLIEIQEILINR